MSDVTAMGVVFLDDPSQLGEADGAYPAMDIIVVDKTTNKGKPAAYVRVEIEGKVYLVGTTARILAVAGDMIKAKFPNLMDDGRFVVAAHTAGATKQ